MEFADLLQQQRRAVLDGDAGRAAELAAAAVATGVDLERCVEEGFVAGIREVGRLWEAGDYFLPELVQGADAMKAALKILRPELARSERAGCDGPVVVLGTVKGDIHDIGKTLVATVLEANGFRVTDLGADVADGAFADEVERSGARILGLSAMLTTTMVTQRRVIESLEARGLRRRVAVLVGGAPVTRRFAVEIGADGYAANALAALGEARRLTGIER